MNPDAVVKELLARSPNPPSEDEVLVKTLTHLKVDSSSSLMDLLARLKDKKLDTQSLTLASIKIFKKEV